MRMKERNYVLIVPPSTLVNTYNRMTPEEKEKIIVESKVSEERLAINACYPCPICGERYTTSYYENRQKKNMFRQDNRRRVPNPETEEEIPVPDGGLIISERELGVKGIFHREKYYVSDFTCTSCHSVYRSKPYRKNHFVKMSV